MLHLYILQNKRCVLNLSICADNHLVAEHHNEMAAVKKCNAFYPKKVF